MTESSDLNRFREILLAVWREACKHIEIHESVAEIAQLLAEHLPLARLVVERVEPVTDSWRPWRGRPGRRSRLPQVAMESLAK